MKNTFLRNIMKTKKIKQCELAKESNLLSQSKLSSILNGWEYPSQKTLRKLEIGMKSLHFTEEEILRALGKRAPD